MIERVPSESQNVDTHTSQTRAPSDESVLISDGFHDLNQRRREHIDHLPDPTTNALYTLLPHPRSPEAIRASYAPLIIGQLGCRARLLEEKCALVRVQVSRNRSREHYS